MGQIKLNSSKELETFLKILAEESVLRSRGEIQNIDNDPAQKEFSQNQQAASIKRLAPMREEEEAEEAEDVQTSSDQEAQSTVSTDVTAVEDVEDSAPTTVSLDTILDTIKQLRSGKSVDDGMIKPQIRAYYDRLDPPERQVLSTFFTAFKDIVTGKSSGEEVQDPSEPPLSINISATDEEEGTEVDTEVEIKSDTIQTMPQEEIEDTEEDEEITPPIKVGEPQKIAEIRKRVRLLMQK
jgi:hypothetical protein